MKIPLDRRKTHMHSSFVYWNAGMKRCSTKISVLQKMVLHWSSSSTVGKILAKCEWSNSFLVPLLQFKAKANLLKITPLQKFFKGVNSCFIEQLWMASSSSYFWLCSFKELQSARGWWKFSKNVLVFFDCLFIDWYHLFLYL